MSPSSPLTLDRWQILFHESMAALLRAHEAVKRQIGLWGVVNGLWKCSRDLRALNATLKLISESPDGTLTDEFIKSQVPQLRSLLKSIEELIDTAKRRQLLNRSLTSVPLGSINIRAQYIADYLETLEMSIDPEVLRAIDEGRSEIERGEYETMERLF